MTVTHGDFGIKIYVSVYCNEAGISSWSGWLNDIECMVEEETEDLMSKKWASVAWPFSAYRHIYLFLWCQVVDLSVSSDCVVICRDEISCWFIHTIMASEITLIHAPFFYIVHTMHRVVLCSLLKTNYCVLGCVEPLIF